MTCPKCNKESPPNAAFCQFCGTSLKAEPSPPKEQPATPAPTTKPPVTPAKTAKPAVPPAPTTTLVTEVPISLQVQKATISFEENADRVELFVRIVWNFLIGLISFLYGIGFGIIILVYTVIAGVLNIINFFVILITAKRWKPAFE